MIDLHTQLVAGLLLAGCPVLPPDAPCPKVHRIGTLAVSGPAWNLIFMPDGFPEHELDVYRCAVRRLVDGLRAVPPFSTHWCHVNVLRMDLASEYSRGGIEKHPDCKDPDCPPGPVVQDPNWACNPEQTAATPVGPPDAPPCATRSLHATLCWGGKDCRVAWLSEKGYAAASRLADCIEPPRVVVVIANTGTYGGGAVAQTSDLSLAVITLAGIEHPTRWRLLAHELGHAMFLLHDEYPYGYANQDYCAGINVASEKEVREDHVAWRCLRTSTKIYRCQQGCPKQCEEEPQAPESYVGLVEGAFYHGCGYFRSSWSCRMRELANDSCPACTLFTDRLAREAGMSSCPAPEGPPGTNPR